MCLKYYNRLPPLPYINYKFLFIKKRNIIIIMSLAIYLSN